MPPDPACHLSLSFQYSGLSRLVHAASWLKASQLVQKQNSTYPALDIHQHKAFFVESTSGGPSKPNYVVLKATGEVLCNCERFKETCLCLNEMANWHKISSGLKKQNNDQICPWWLVEELPAVRDTNVEQKDHVAETEIPLQGMKALLLMTSQD